ncbi:MULTISPECIES: MFS transporter [Nocardiaceae]|uniref:MFS transporter n=1 Tax=Nocardiaceae TaxID=85025 RepID=UPI000AA7C7D5|nr:MULTISPECIES: MFS transporter [Rhodococcus]
MSSGSTRPATDTASLVVALLGFFVITLDALVVIVALPQIAGDVGGGITGLQWVVDGYTLMFAALLLFAGALSDRIGARRTYCLGLIVFVLASAACAFAPSLGSLIAGRLLQGVGAALITPSSLALLREAFPDSARRARAIGIWALGGAVAAAAGPLLGGSMSLVSWRLIFLVNIPVGLVMFVLLARIPTSARRTVPFDWAGQISALTALASLTYGVIEVGAVGIADPRIVGAAVAAVVGSVIFLCAQKYGRHPMVPLDLFSSRPVTIAVFTGFAFMVGYYGMVFLFSLYYQQERGLSVLQTGLAFMPMTLLVSIMNVVAGRATARYGPRVPVTLGMAMMALGLGLLWLWASRAPVPILALFMVPVGLGGALAMPAVTAMLFDSVPAEHAGTAGGVLNTSRQIGGALAIGIFGSLVAHQGLDTGVQTSLAVATVLLVVSTVVALGVRKRQSATAFAQ